MRRFKSCSWFLSGILFSWTALVSGMAFGGTCSSPNGNEGDVIYNSASHTYQFCNGLGWLRFGGGSTCTTPTGGYSPATSSGTGYFVLTSTTFTGNMGGIQGADASCLTELTTNTTWKGYSTANGNGQLIASKVHAFLSGSNLMPLTTYYFAVVGSAATGGASFTTDSSGLGPNDSANWTGASYFGGTYTYWTVRDASNGSTQWANIGNFCCGIGSCNNYTDASSGNNGAAAGTSSFTDQNRWTHISNPACNNSYPLICFVNP